MKEVMYFLVITLYSYNALISIQSGIKVSTGQDIARTLQLLSMIVGAFMFATNFMHINKLGLSAQVWAFHLLYMAGVTIQNRDKEIKAVKDILNDLKKIVGKIKFRHSQTA